MNKWFELRGKLDETTSWVFTVLGLLLTLVIWWALAELLSTKNPIVHGYNPYLPSSLDSMSVEQRDSIIRQDSIVLNGATEFKKVYPLLPRPDQVLFSFKDLYTKDNVVGNTMHSVWLNVQGYFWAIILSLLFGLVMGLFPIFRSLFNKQVDAMRYLPLSALTGLFITWFGLGDPMKIAFLALGILVYLLPVVIQRIDEVDDVLAQTAYTLGASKWQQIKTVFIPAVISRLTDDIRVLTAISWTYIIIAELLNKGQGIGSLIYTKSRQGQVDRVFALLLIIMFIGMLQDKLFVIIDKIINPHKYYNSQVNGLDEGRIGLYAILTALILGILCTYFLKLDLFCTIGWILLAAGFMSLVYAFIRMQNSNVK
jgi:NitT/TauT family transport system permease protein